MALDITPIYEPGFTVEAKQDTIFMSGNISLKNPELILKTFFDKINEKIIHNGIKSIVLDLTKLKFLNSTCIKTLAKWVLSINNLPEHERYSVKIKYDSTNIWQDSIMSTFSYLNPKLISIEKIDLPLI